MRPRRAHLVAATLMLAAAAPLAAHAATSPEPVASRDAAKDVTKAPDLVRVELSRAKDGRLRAALTLASEFNPSDLVAKSGPPGSICVRAWTLTSPGTVPPDFLVCASATASGQRLRGTVATEQVDAQPKRVATASVTRPTQRTVVLTFSKTSVSGGKSIRRIRFAAEATRPGCVRTTCTDTAPDAPKTLTYDTRAARR